MKLKFITIFRRKLSSAFGEWLQRYSVWLCDLFIECRLLDILQICLETHTHPHQIYNTKHAQLNKYITFWLWWVGISNIEIPTSTKVTENPKAPESTSKEHSESIACNSFIALRGFLLNRVQSSNNPVKMKPHLKLIFFMCGILCWKKKDCQKTTKYQMMKIVCAENLWVRRMQNVFEPKTRPNYSWVFFSNEDIQQNLYGDKTSYKLRHKKSESKGQHKSRSKEQERQGGGKR